jgi:hypothetical protein
MVSEYQYGPISKTELLLPVYIAAHAVVVRPLADCWETVWQIGDVEVVDSGQLTCYYDEFNYSGPVGHFYPAFEDPYTIGTHDPTDFPWNSNADASHTYATDFDVDWNGELLFGGKLTTSWSLGCTGSETKIITADTGETTTIGPATGSCETPGPTNWQGYVVQQDTLMLNPVAAGAHSIRFQQTTGNGTLWDWITLEKPCEQWETAWGSACNGDGNSFRFVPRGNWGTYFMYPAPCDLVGEWELYVEKTHPGYGEYYHDMTITTHSGSSISGTGGYPETGPPYAITWVMTGTVTDGNVSFSIDYDSSPYIFDTTSGAVACCNSMSGTWLDSNSKSGNWTATRVP